MRRHAKAIVAILAMLLLSCVGGVAPALAAPVVSIDPPSAPTHTTVQVSGTVDLPGGEFQVRYGFEYSTDGVNWSPFEELGLFDESTPAGPHNVSTELTGLQAGTQYSVRLVARLWDESDVFSPDPNPTFTTQSVSTPTASIDPVAAITATTAHFSGTINPEALLGSPDLYDVAWHFQCTPACPGLVGGTIAADPNNHVVEADTTGLIPGTAYKVELVAKNAGPAVNAGPQSFTTLADLPVIEYTTANPTADAATLRARINPRGGETSYHFEYGPTAAYGQSTATDTIPKGNNTVAVRAAIAGLAQQSGYHFRVVATNAAGTTNGPDRGFATENPPAESCPNAAVRSQQHATALGECRAYEMVSPLDKHKAGVTGLYSYENYNGGFSNGGVQLSADGNALLFTIPSGTLGGSKSAPGFSRFVSYRSGGDWSARPVDPPIGPDSSFLRPWLTFGANDDVSRTVVYSNKALAPGGIEGGRNAYVYDIKNDSYELIASGSQLEGRWSEAGAPPIQAAAPDFSTLIFGGLEWRQGVGLHPLQVEIDGTPVPDSGLAARQVSTDGKRTLLYAGGGGGYLGGLYLREEGKPQIQVSASQRSGDDPAVWQPVYLPTASSDLSKIFFRSPVPLTDDSLVGEESIYRYDTATGKLTDLMADVAPGNLMLTGFFPQVSADGSTIVFEARGALVPGVQAGPPHIYLWRNGEIQQVPAGGVGFANSLTNEAQLSSDGRYLAIPLQGQATSYVSKGPGCEQTGGGPPPGNDFCAQLYVYDSVAETMRCASCQPDGEPPKGYAVVRPSQVPGSTHTANYLTDDGKVAFESSDQLVPRDVNEKRDVYTWQDGHLELISGGDSEGDSLFSEMSKDGSTIAFVTRQQLVGRDTDELQDAYVSRVGGGLSSQSFPPPTPADCGGADECRGAVTSPPPASKGGTEAFDGAANGGGRSTVTVVRGRKTASKPGSLRVAVSGPGKIVVSGDGAKRTVKQVAKQGTYPVTVTPQGGALKKLREKGQVTVKVTVRFLPRAGSPSSTGAQVTFKQGNSKGGN